VNRGIHGIALLLLVVALATSGCVASEDDGNSPGCAARGSEDGQSSGAYGTEERGILILAAQAVPSATILPCIDAYPVGWTFGGTRITNDAFRFWLDSDRAGLRAVEVRLTEGCTVGSAVEVVPGEDEVGTRRFEAPLALPPNYAVNRYYTFEGGCIEYRYRFRGTDDPALALEADQALGFRTREDLVTDLAAIGLHLCGAGAPPCAGEAS
jgi:hypothetical protein